MSWNDYNIVIRFLEFMTSSRNLLHDWHEARRAIWRVFTSLSYHEREQLGDSFTQITAGFRKEAALRGTIKVEPAKRLSVFKLEIIEYYILLAKDFTESLHVFPSTAGETV